MTYTLTDEQTAVVDAFRGGKNIAVTAYAGAGKTSTLVHAAAATPNKRVVFTAFNKKIIQDSASRFGRNTRCQTTHSLATHVASLDGGWRWRRMDAPRLNGRPLATLLNVRDPLDIGGGRLLHPSRQASLAVAMVHRFAQTGDDDLGWWHLKPGPGFEDPDTRKGVGITLLPAARRAWADLTSPNGSLRYTHDLYRKEWALTHPRIEADIIMVDEAQDSAGVLVRLLADQVSHGTQIVTVGDPFQAINGWAGAVDAMDKFAGEQLYMTQSFRFGEAIADEANKWLRLLGAPAPLRGNPAVQSFVTDVEAPDAILYRTNGSVVAEVIDRLAAGQNVAMLGDPREITSFTQGARDLKTKGWSSHPDLSVFQSWGQVQDYVDNDALGQDLKVMVAMIDKHGEDAIERAMTRLSPPARADIVVSTAHKVKGAEWFRVKVGDDFREPKPDLDDKIRPSREVAMLAYVTVTRGRTALDRGSLAWVDRATGCRAPVVDSDATGTPVAAADAPAAPVADVDAVIVALAADDPKLSVVEWRFKDGADGRVRAVGRGPLQWAAISGTVDAPDLTWHHYMTQALAHVGSDPNLAQQGA